MYNGDLVTNCINNTLLFRHPSCSAISSSLKLATNAMARLS